MHETLWEGVRGKQRPPSAVRGRLPRVFARAGFPKPALFAS